MHNLQCAVLKPKAQANDLSKTLYIWDEVNIAIKIPSKPQTQSIDNKGSNEMCCAVCQPLDTILMDAVVSLLQEIRFNPIIQYF